MTASAIARVSGLYSRPEASPITAKEAAQELWDADLAVAEAEEDEASGWGYDEAARERESRAREAYRRIVGKAAPARLTTQWLASHQ